MKGLVYKGVLITKLFPSGYYQFYSNKEGRFLSFDSLFFAKRKLNLDGRKPKNQTHGKIHN